MTISRRSFLTAAGVTALAPFAGAGAAQRGAVLDVKKLGAVGDGRTSDLAALRGVMREAAGQASGATIVFPPGEYYLGSASDALLIGATKLQNVKIVGDKATITCRSEKGVSSMFYLAGCRNVSIEGFTFRDQGFDREAPSLLGASGIRIATEGTVASEGIDIRNCTFESVLSGVVCRSADRQVRSRRITLTNLTVRRSYYGFGFEDNGDDVVARGLRCDDVRRSYFPYGVSNHDIELDTANNATGFTDVLIKCYHGDTLNLRVKVRCRGKRSGDAIVALDNQHEQGRGTIANISLDLDIDDADCRLDRIVLIRSLTPAAPGAPPVRTERQTSNRWDGIYIEGDVKLCDRTKLLDIATEGRTPGTLTLGPRFAQHPRLPREFPGFIVKKA